MSDSEIASAGAISAPVVIFKIASAASMRWDAGTGFEDGVDGAVLEIASEMLRDGLDAAWADLVVAQYLERREEILAGFKDLYSAGEDLREGKGLKQRDPSPAEQKDFALILEVIAAAHPFWALGANLAVGLDMAVRSLVDRFQCEERRTEGEVKAFSEKCTVARDGLIRSLQHPEGAAEDYAVPR